VCTNPSVSPHGEVQEFSDPHVLDAAMEVFREKGYEAAVTRTDAQLKLLAEPGRRLAFGMNLP
jgi:hypothetical protein